MTEPVESFKTYGTMYHDFTEAYVTVDQLARDFYPMAKKFVESTEPEISKQMKKLSAEGNTIVNPKLYQAVIHYMSHFDDFTITANKLFADIKNALQQSEDFMNKVLYLKQKAENNPPEPVEEYTILIPELTTIIDRLKQALAYAGTVEKQMKNLQTDWGNIKQKIN